MRETSNLFLHKNFAWLRSFQKESGTIAAIIITCSPFFSQQIISDYITVGSAELFPITVSAAVAVRKDRK